MCKWGVGGDSTVIRRWKFGEQVCNTELLLERCQSGVSLRLPDGWSCRKRLVCEWMLDSGSWSGMGPGFHSDYVVEMWCAEAWSGGGYSTLIWQWKYGEQVYNPELVLEGCGEFMPLLGRNGSSGKYVLIALRMSVIDREKESIDGRLIGRVGGEVHKCR
ncbi:hypothetical protein T08_4235 [Trichinella sp. T8]|nr:hypothetical protein T08_10460 [Trichinella sp. T8]KRZ91692.1 hypothetical protein T08_4235 [Trichinella sp. T8]